MANIFETDQVLRDEALAIRGEKAAAVNKAATGKPLYRALNDLRLNALCLSGGGIRSAAFALGVIQALAIHPRKGSGTAVGSAGDSLLAKFDYLSTVSGGGYIGGWLSAWVGRAGFAATWPKLADRRATPEHEPEEIAWLRRYSNYLTPKLGLMSADTWAAIALFLRNLILNWLVIIPVVCGGILILKLVAVGVAWFGKISIDGEGFALAFAGLALLCVVTSARFTTRHRPTRGRHRATQTHFLYGGLLPSLLSGVLMTFALAVPYAHDHTKDLDLFAWGAVSLIPISALIGFLAYGAGWLLAFPRRRGPEDYFWDLAAWMIAGAVYGSLVAVAVYIHRLVYGVGFWEFDTSELVLLIFGVPWVITSQLLADMIFVGLTSNERNSDSDREWLGRAAGWFLLTALGWFIVMFLALIAAQAVIHFYSRFSNQIHAAIGAAVPTLASAIGTALLGKSAASPAQGPSKTWTGLITNIALGVAASIFAVLLIVAISALLDKILIGSPLLETKDIHGPISIGMLPPWPETLTALLKGLAVVGVVGLIASKFVNINRFSLHALYRNRLVRAFLGASNPNRNPDPFIGFDDDDNWPMSKLWPARRTDGWQPFHVVNAALNIVSTKNYAWQERKAESFTMSPLHCGSACKQYRSSAEYGDQYHGISLGTAVAISGAAASPNMGYHSSPAVTFLMALLNVRLGWWFGNPGLEGEKTFKKEGPKTAIRPLLEETFGLTTDTSPYVYLSDGGHFENLGLYEMVRRRCKCIIVSDAGCDGDFDFADLGNAIRKIRLDLGVTIRFKGLTALRKRPKDGHVENAPYFAIGKIDYPAADDAKNSEEGIILYINPSYHGTEAAPIRSYAVANPDFPHESTVDQWFSESQFESYRALGFEITDDVLGLAFTAFKADQLHAAGGDPTKVPDTVPDLCQLLGALKLPGNVA